MFNIFFNISNTILGAPKLSTIFINLARVNFDFWKIDISKFLAYTYMARFEISPFCPFNGAIRDRMNPESEPSQTWRILSRSHHRPDESWVGAITDLMNPETEPSQTLWILRRSHHIQTLWILNRSHHRPYESWDGAITDLMNPESEPSQTL